MWRKKKFCERKISKRRNGWAGNWRKSVFLLVEIITDEQMKKLHVFMLKSFVGPFVATFFISMFVLMMQFLWMHIDDLVGKGLDGEIILQLLMYVSMTLVPMGLPLAVLLALPPSTPVPDAADVSPASRASSSAASRSALA